MPRVTMILLLGFVLTGCKLGGYVTGLEGSVTLQEEISGSTLVIDKIGPFEFGRPYLPFANFRVAVSEPSASPDQECKVINGEGTLYIDDFLNIQVSCKNSDTYIYNGPEPNIVIIFTDDQGYQDLGVYGHPLIQTPNLDRMADDGIRFTSFYTGFHVCTASRAALLTGCYPGRNSMGPDVIFDFDTWALHPEEVTIAEILRDAGYATGMIGKWHLGHSETEFLPTSQGFDYYYGIPYSNDMPNFLFPTPPYMRGEEIVEQPIDQDLIIQRYTQESLQFIEDNKDKPFFLYLAHNMPHYPAHASDAFRGRSASCDDAGLAYSCGLYADVIAEIDWSTGQILNKLDELGLDERTLVIFTSDNGPWQELLIYLPFLLQDPRPQTGSADPLRGAKRSSWEGGFRVPAIMRWPGHIPAGQVSDAIVAAIDLFPTIANLADAAMPTDRIIDGENIWPILSGQSDGSDHAPFYYDIGALTFCSPGAIRQGQWKLRGDKLYNLSTDIHEDRDVADLYPHIKEELEQLYADKLAEIEAGRRPYGGTK